MDDVNPLLEVGRKLFQWDVLGTGLDARVVGSKPDYQQTDLRYIFPSIPGCKNLVKMNLFKASSQAKLCSSLLFEILAKPSPYYIPISRDLGRRAFSRTHLIHAESISK